MRHIIGDARIPLVGEYRFAGQRLHRHRRDELGRGLRHHDLHCGACLAQRAGQFRCLVTGNAAS